MAILRHELWIDPEGLAALCYAGPMGEDARSLLPPGSQLVWEVEGGSHFEVMTLYYEHMNWGIYATELDWDYQPYPEEWRRIQLDADSSTGSNSR